MPDNSVSSDIFRKWLECQENKERLKQENGWYSC